MFELKTYALLSRTRFGSAFFSSKFSMYDILCNLVMCCFVFKLILLNRFVLFFETIQLFYSVLIVQRSAMVYLAL